ncbi:MAG: hypothetical protein R3Y27_07130 [Clostridia bacterium]
MLFLFFFFSRKKENAIFLVTFFGQAKKRNAPAAAETALTASTKHKYKTENYPQQQIIIDIIGNFAAVSRADNIRPYKIFYHT